MKISKLFALTAFLFIACSKENNYTQLQSAEMSNGSTAADTVKIPINDLQNGTFRGQRGGLYPNGKNVPTGTYAIDLMKASQSIVPIDSFGNHSNNGRIVFISLGGSTGGKNMVQLREQTTNNPACNPKLALLNCNNGYGSASLNSMANPDDPYWDHVTKIIHGNGGSYRQIQVIYLETDHKSVTSNWPYRPNLIRQELESVLRVFRQKFAKLKVVYVLGRTRTFGDLNAPWNKEPCPYYFGWACKQVIEDQINGVPGTEYKGKNAVAPIITWGWYQWADTMPRQTDGFYWTESQTKDGLHATPEGQVVLATRFQNFLLTNIYTRNWYAK